MIYQILSKKEIIQTLLEDGYEDRGNHYFKQNEPIFDKKLFDRCHLINKAYKTNLKDCLAIIINKDVLILKKSWMKRLTNIFQIFYEINGETGKVFVKANSYIQAEERFNELSHEKHGQLNYNEHAITILRIGRKDENKEGETMSEPISRKCDCCGTLVERINIVKIDHHESASFCDECLSSEDEVLNIIG